MTDHPAHDLLPCRLTIDGKPICTEVAVVSVMDHAGDVEWGCELHAARALESIHGAKINSVGDWEAARRLLALPWNAAGTGPAL